MIQTNLVPMFYYPLKVVFADDNKTLLDLFERSFADKFNIRTFFNPTDALKYINEQNNEKNNPFAEISNFIDNEDTAHIGINISNIINIVNNSERFNRIGILVTDQEMPQMNGLELCKELVNIPLKKILLTGQFLDKPAINALNNNIINCYVEKASPKAINDIEHYIHILTQRYFLDLTQSILGDVEQSQLAILQNGNFVKIFKETVDKYLIKEYYLLDGRGSFLLLDGNEKRYILNVHNEESLKEFCNFFTGEKQVASLIEDVKNQKKVPFFGIGVDPMSVALKDWSQYFYPANIADSFIWSLISL